MGMKGQTLVVGAVIFAGILLIASFPTGPSIVGTESNTQLFSENALETSVEAFNRGLSEEKSYPSVRTSLYRYNRFLERVSTAKGIEYDSYQFFILPEEEEAGFINYRASKANITVELGDETWENEVIQSDQEKKFSYSMTGDRTTVNLTLNGKDQDFDFQAASPRLLAWMSFDSDDETWANSLVG